MARMPPPLQFGTPTPRTSRGSIRSPTEGSCGMIRMPPPSALAHPSHGSWPHSEIHRRPQWHDSHAAP
eukprot:6522673-Pyramimonas_sp.AAC.1